jgi:hypothetical protein
VSTFQERLRTIELIGVFIVCKVSREVNANINIQTQKDSDLTTRNSNE